MWKMRPRPRTKTRDLPYVIGRDYQRLVRLVRIFDHEYQWHSFESRRLIERQCESLHLRIYKEPCYYGGF